jgi:hypothetical protein
MTMPKKPFLVTVEFEVAIFAENEDDVYSSSEMRDAIYDSTLFTADCIASVQPLNRIPDGWDENCLVYGADRDVTVKEALEWDKKLNEEPEDRYTMLLPYDDK